MYLLIAPNGMLGHAWVKLLESTGENYETATREQLDLTRDDLSAVTDETTVVVNCAAYTDVDGAETHEALATQINGTGVGHLASRCQQTGALLVHYSTDYVFNGHATEPYAVDAPIEPINAYGRSKAIGERLIRESGCRHLICRTSWLYAPWGKNFVRTIASLAAERDELKIVNDQRGRPTSCRQLAAQTLALIQHQASGTFHTTDAEECTWYEFAQQIVRLTEAACDVKPCTTADFPRPAVRPPYSVLDLSRIEQTIGPALPWPEALADAIAEMRSD